MLHVHISVRGAERSQKIFYFFVSGSARVTIVAQPEIANNIRVVVISLEQLKFFMRLIRPTMFRRIHIRTGSAIFYTRNVSSMIVKYPIIDGSPISYGLSTIYHGFLCGSA
jgi:hypothetical protein